MPGFLLHSGATVECLHGGQATAVSPNPRVTASGQAAVSISSPYVIAGCMLSPVEGGPCVAAQFVTSAARVTSLGQPLLLFDSQAVCAPTRAPLLIITTQTRVTAV